ncbi:conserved hypothetical protein [Beggiatoa sp. PS]|nr:conserved hypothetical protein [Beggiatoa sp. PS]
MRFIKKNEQAPDCLNQLVKQYKQPKTCYDKLTKNKKNKECKNLIQQQMLEEQQYLCAYCERKVENNNDVIHIEHIRPRLHYLEKVCDYKNLILSCHGSQCPDVNQADYQGEIHSCGHHPAKGNYFDEAKFLNPVELTDISDYFSYRIDEGRIDSSEKDTIKADYMICLLNLDNPYLNNGRINARKALLKMVQKSSQNKQEAIKIFKQLLNLNHPPAFISYLRYYFHHSFNISDSN